MRHWPWNGWSDHNVWVIHRKWISVRDPHWLHWEKRHQRTTCPHPAGKGGGEEHFSPQPLTQLQIALQWRWPWKGPELSGTTGLSGSHLGPHHIPTSTTHPNPVPLQTSQLSRSSQGHQGSLSWMPGNRKTKLYMKKPKKGFRLYCFNACLLVTSSQFSIISRPL